ncbi:DUF3800 domain-containing protein [Streptomyces sp. AC536]|nr:DUF3800 domain-containing protein [Streptomyces buecherae]QNJ40065.1 DUF3800 domain-containing protein [Streptomyces buecherae]
MYLCYIDESGTAQVLNPDVPDSVPVMVIGGFTVPEELLTALASDFIELKKRFRPELRTRPTLRDVVHHEVKGETLRKSFRRTGRKQRRAAHGFLDHLLNLLEQHHCTVLARVWVKQNSVVYDEEDLYASSIAVLCKSFENYLAERAASGIVVLDSRNPSDNAGSVHGITARKFSKDGDELPHLPESPVFGHSNTHLGLQIADLLVSAILAPSAAATYAADLVGNVHCDPRFAEVRERHCPRLGKLQYRYQDGQGKWTGGIVVSDARGQQSARRLFEPAPHVVRQSLHDIQGHASTRDLAAVASFPESAAPAP